MRTKNISGWPEVREYMIVYVSRSAADLMSDMYTIRFPGHPNRIIPFSVEEWENASDLRLERGEEARASLRVVDWPMTREDAG